MPETETIQVLGRGTNVNFSIDDSVPFELAERRLREYLSECRGLYSSGTVTVNVGRRILSPDQMAAIKCILGQETGLTVSRYWCSPEALSKALAGAESRRVLPSPVIEIADNHIDDQIGPAVFPEIGLPRDCRDEAESDMTLPAIPVETASGEGRQLAMEFPGLDGEQRAGAVMQKAAGEDKETLQDVHNELAPTLAVEESNPVSMEPVGNEELLADGNVEEEPVSGPVSQSLAEVSDTAGEAAHSGFLGAPSRGSEALIVKNTCRSGEVIRYAGDVVVFGDVNPGAEIIAAGDIVVLGALRGMAHAGAEGDLKATILALNLASHRLQIGSCVGERSRKAKKGRGAGKAVNPQIAYLRRRSIFVAPFERRCEEYRGGVPYEG